MIDLLNYFSISSQLLLQAARERWLEAEIIADDLNFFEVRSLTKRLFFRNTDFGSNSSFALKMADDKKFTHTLLSRTGFPVPETIYIKKEDQDNLDTILRGFPFPAVLKPIDGAHGEWVVTGIEDQETLTTLLKESLKHSDEVLVQEHVAGDEYRVLVLEGEAFLIIRRDPAHVVWDGAQTIRELIEEANKDPNRWEWYEKPLSYIVADDRVESFLAKSGKTLDTVPEANERVQLLGVSNLGQWGTAENVTNIASPQIKQLCERLAHHFHFGFIGIDVMTKDISSPQTNDFRIIEINATPGIGWHKELFDFDTAGYVIDKLFFDEDDEYDTPQTYVWAA